MTIDEEMDWIKDNNSLIKKTDEANVDRIVRNAIGTAAADVLADKVLEKAGMFDELVEALHGMYFHRETKGVLDLLHHCRTLQS